MGEGIRVCATKGSYFSHKEMGHMNVTKNLGMLLLSIWLILSGLIGLIHLSFAGLFPVMGILAIVAGILILLGK